MRASVTLMLTIDQDFEIIWTKCRLSIENLGQIECGVTESNILFHL